MTILMMTWQEGPCSPTFCECSLGVPYRLHCEEPLIFNEEMGWCDFCYNMCDTCSADCGGCGL
jgi:hypothetical protein